MVHGAPLRGAAGSAQGCVPGGTKVLPLSAGRACAARVASSLNGPLHRASGQRSSSLTTPKVRSPCGPSRGHRSVQRERGFSDGWQFSRCKHPARTGGRSERSGSRRQGPRRIPAGSHCRPARSHRRNSRCCGNQARRGYRERRTAGRITGQRAISEPIRGYSQGSCYRSEARSRRPGSRRTRAHGCRARPVHIAG
jgi:hypothetical protein